MPTSRYDPCEKIPTRFLRDGNVGQAVSPNERAILAEIWTTGGLTRSALGPRLDLTQQSIHRIISQLEARGMLRIGPLEPPTYKGKPSPRLTLNPAYACVPGISINTDSAGLALMDFAGSYETRTLPIDGVPMADVLDRIDAELDTLLDARGLTRGDIFGIGFAIAGYVVEGTRYSAPEPLAEWSYHQLGPLLATHFDLPVWTENGANTGALCERMLGVGRTVRNFVYLSFNYGFGGGIIVEGNLLRGGFGNAGELSGMFPDDEIADRPALRSLVEMLQAGGVNIQTIEDLKSGFDMAWPGVDTWLDRVTPHFNRVYNVLNATVDPEVVVLGGQIPKPLAEALIARAVSYSRPRHGARRRAPDLCVSGIGGDTSAVGAAALALKEGFF
ncbi:ROK family protein [Tabrizicola sp.]|uniref:ROK family protein n=1 Tax=Tabrizicola sp. TaxID=2005166 RepID=UPI003F3D0249